MVEDVGAKREDSRRRRERRREEAEALLPDIEEAVRPFQVRRPSAGVVHVCDGMGPVLLQWWPGSHKWMEMRSGRLSQGNAQHFLDYLRRGDWRG